MAVQVPGVSTGHVGAPSRAPTPPVPMRAAAVPASPDAVLAGGMAGVAGVPVFGAAAPAAAHGGAPSPSMIRARTEALLAQRGAAQPTMAQPAGVPQRVVGAPDEVAAGRRQDELEGRVLAARHAGERQALQEMMMTGPGVG